MRIFLAFFVTIAVRAADDSGGEHWAFQPLASVRPPVVESTVGHTPVDAFLLEKLEARGLTLSPLADRAALLRRVTFDLIGLPPSPDELAAFGADQRPAAYERVVDRLLASPHFGERWGRYWLDTAGYSDIVGGDNDAGIIKLATGKWRYRDYVVRSFNEDKPYADFLTEQLAGDELVDWREATTYTPRTLELLTATTFLRATADDTAENELNTPDIRNGVLQRTAELVSGSLLGLTFQCAKCHDHKYDPVSQEDYYRFVALFAPAFNPGSWKQPADRDLPMLAAAEKTVVDEHNASLARREKEIADERGAINKATRNRVLEPKLLTLPADVREAVRRALDTPPMDRDAEQKRLVDAYSGQLSVSDEERDAARSMEERARLAALDVEGKELSARRISIDVVHAVYDVGPPSPTYLLVRGDPLTPGNEVEPGFPRILSQRDRISTLTTVSAATKTGRTSGRRLALARWLATRGTRGHALSRRVFVNRAWQQLFGRGLVTTSENLGRAGSRPSHPELLEWLAGEFHAGGESVKVLLRQLVTSTVYRQSSQQPPPGSLATTADPENDLLSRARLRRLESEAIRDAVLAVSGNLERRLGGPAVPLKVRPDGMVIVGDDLASPSERLRRSVYMLARRNYHLSLLATFDQPVVTSLCARRTRSAVVTQSLTMLNDAFINEQARGLAERVLATLASPADSAVVDLAFRLALTRSPTEDESAWCQEFLSKQREHFAAQEDAAREAGVRALAELCHTLLNTSEFLYVP